MVSTAALRRASEPGLRGLEDFVIDFVDDWMCRSANFDEHLTLLFERISLQGITVNFDKVEFCREKLKFLSHIITPKGVMPDPEKVQGIRDFPTPSNIRQLRGFVGLVNFYSKYTCKFAKESAQLLALTHEHVKCK